MKWLEVSFELPGELVEPVVDLLARLAGGGVSVLEQPKDGQTAGSLLTVTAYLPIDSQLQAARQRLDEGLWHLSQISPIPPPAYRTLAEENWADSWKEHYRPIPIGRRLLIQPAWLDLAPGSDRLPIRIEPGMAFGTGVHPTTRLVLAALEDRILPGMRVADMGCGSGILSIAAAVLGAGSVLALDIDPIAVDVATKNLAANGVGEKARVDLGSLTELQRAVARDGRGFDLILANILADVLRDLLSQGLAGALTPDGVIVMSGILEDQTRELLNACQGGGLTLVETLAEADWRALVLKREPPPDTGGGEYR